MTIKKIPLTVDYTQTGSSSGLLSARPSASSAGAGHFYTATDTGISYVSNGFDWFNAQIDSLSGVVTVTESNISLSDVTTDNVTSAAHGFAPKSPADATKFLHGAATPGYAQVKDSDLSTTDITTNNVSISKHGFTPKLPNDDTKFLDGTGAYTVPGGTGSVSSDAIWDAKGDLAVGTGANAASKLAVGSDGQVLTADSTQSTGTKWAAGGGSSSVSSARISRAVAVGGDITLNHPTTMAEIAAATGGPGTGGLDLTIAAAAGDILELSGTFSLNNTTAVSISFDIATWVSGAAVNWIGQSGGGASTFGVTFVTSGQSQMVSWSIQYVVQAGDISGGNVVLRPHYRSGSATNRVLGRSTTSGAFQFAVANLLQ